METVVGVLLEYCGGLATDRLYSKLIEHISFPFYVLDNASSRNHCTCATHYNKVNSGVGGGIRDSFDLAASVGASILVFCTNDIDLIGSEGVNDLVTNIERDNETVQIGASLTQESEQSQLYPWMAKQDGSRVHRVPHCDLLCCAVKVDFVRSFGWFPQSRGGYGYDWELAYHAHYHNKRILVHDGVTIAHVARISSMTATQERRERELEQYAVYGLRYGRSISAADCVTRFAVETIASRGARHQSSTSLITNE